MSAHNTDGHLPVSPRPNLTVVPHAEEGVPAARLRRSLNRMTRGRRVPRRAILRVLVIEHVLIGRQRDASSTSYAENLTRGLGKAAGDHVLGRTNRTLDGLASKADSIRGEQAMLRTRAGYRQGDLVPIPTGACGPSPRPSRTKTASAPRSRPTSMPARAGTGGCPRRCTGFP